MRDQDTQFVLKTFVSISLTLSRTGGGVNLTRTFFNVYHGLTKNGDVSKKLELRILRNDRAMAMLSLKKKI